MACHAGGMDAAPPSPKLAFPARMSIGPTFVTFVTFVTFQLRTFARQMAKICRPGPKLMKLITP